MDEKFVDSMLTTIVMFDKAYKTFKSQNPELSNDEILALTDVWWRGLMDSIAKGSLNKGDDIDGFNY